MDRKTDKMLDRVKYTKDIDTVQKLYEETRDNNPKLGFSYAKLLYDEGSYDEAKAVLKKVITQKSINIYITNSYLLLGKIEANLGNFTAAKEYFNIVIKKGKSVDYAFLELARIFYYEKDVEKTRFYLKEALRSGNKYAYNALAMLEFKEGNDKKSIQTINDAINNGYCNKEGVDFVLLEYFIKKYNIFFKNEFINEHINLDMVEYDKERAINHIYERHVNNEDDKYNFYYDVDVETLMEKAQENMTKANKQNVLVFYDYYVIPNRYLGIDDDYYLKVVTMPHTKDIITMYPVKNKFETDMLTSEFTENSKTKK